jgi:hypothetical protein
MMQCERCGASNQPQSRFCVSCGSPMLPSSPGTGSKPAAAPQQAAQPPAAPYHRPPVQPQYPQGASQAPAWSPAQPSPYPAPQPHHYPTGPAVALQGPPSQSLPFAETAAPPSQEDFQRIHAARQAALGAYPHPGSGSMPAANYAPTAPPPRYPGAQPDPSPYPQATAAMPGVAQDPLEVPEGAPRILCGFLVTYEGDPMGAFWPIHQGRNLVGRDGAPIPLDIRIGHPTTSSRHAVLRAAALPGRIKLEDLGSTNGTFVNDARLSQGQPVELKDGDRVRFGLFACVVKIVDTMPRAG